MRRNFLEIPRNFEVKRKSMVLAFDTASFPFSSYFITLFVVWGGIYNYEIQYQGTFLGNVFLDDVAYRPRREIFETRSTPTRSYTCSVHNSRKVHNFREVGIGRAVNVSMWTPPRTVNIRQSRAFTAATDTHGFHLVDDVQSCRNFAARLHPLSRISRDESRRSCHLALYLSSDRWIQTGKRDAIFPKYSSRFLCKSFCYLREVPTLSWRIFQYVDEIIIKYITFRTFDSSCVSYFYLRILRNILYEDMSMQVQKYYFFFKKRIF